MIADLGSRWLVLHLNWLAVWLFCCGAGGAVMAGNGERGSSGADGYLLDLNHTTARQVLGPELPAPEESKFVQVQVTQVTNPQRIGLSFTVHFQPAQGETVDLGVFSLFPPDNPGKFIVATRGLLRSGGTVSVTLVPLQKISGEENVRVWIKPLTFLAE
jgi:hypothetical protein